MPPPGSTDAPSSGIRICHWPGPAGVREEVIDHLREGGGSLTDSESLFIGFVRELCAGSRCRPRPSIGPRLVLGEVGRGGAQCHRRLLHPSGDGHGRVRRLLTESGPGRIPVVDIHCHRRVRARRPTLMKRRPTIGPVPRSHSAMPSPKRSTAANSPTSSPRWSWSRSASPTWTPWESTSRRWRRSLPDLLLGRPRFGSWRSAHRQRRPRQTRRLISGSLRRSGAVPLQDTEAAVAELRRCLGDSASRVLRSERTWKVKRSRRRASIRSGRRLKSRSTGLHPSDRFHPSPAPDGALFLQHHRESDRERSVPSPI